MKGIPLPAQSPRPFALPDEIWEVILDILSYDHSSLANLALVSPEANLLAKSRQFCSVRLTYSDQTIEFLLHTVEQAVKLTFSARNPPLGRFIREIIVKTNPHHIAQRHKFGTCLSSSIHGLDADELFERIQEGEQFYLEDYIGCISHLVEMGALPNLYCFDWRDKITVPVSLILSILESPAKEIKLACSIDGNVCSILDSSFHRSRDIRHLTFHSLSLLECSSFLKLVAPTIESLSLDIEIAPFSTRATDFSKIFCQAKQSQTYYCPRLKTLHIGAKIACPNLSTLMTSPVLHALIIENSQSLPFTSSSSLCHVSSNAMLSLREFICRSPDIPMARIEPFLLVNPQLTKIAISVNNVKMALAIMARNMSQIISLSIESSCSDIDSESLGVLAQLTTLRQLHLSLQLHGAPVYWDAETVGANLARLVQLRRLALSRDTFQRLGAAITESSNYYHPTDINEEEIEMAKKRPHLDGEINYRKLSPRRIFEIAHRNRMLDLAEFYASKIRALEFVFVGQRAIEIVKRGSTIISDKKKVEAQVVTKSRSDLQRYIRYMWGHPLETWSWDN